jgi:hypothetical protein
MPDFELRVWGESLLTGRTRLLPEHGSGQLLTFAVDTVDQIAAVYLDGVDPRHK